MRLSEAMMLGSTTCKMEAGNWNSCALGCAANAVGIMQCNADGYCPDLSARHNRIEATWPWLTRNYTAPYPYLEIDSAVTLTKWGRTRESAFTTHIFTRFDVAVVNGAMTLEELADWVRSVEPSCGDCNQFDCTCVQKMDKPQLQPAETFAY